MHWSLRRTSGDAGCPFTYLKHHTSPCRGVLRIFTHMRMSARADVARTEFRELSGPEISARPVLPYPPRHVGERQPVRPSCALVMKAISLVMARLAVVACTNSLASGPRIYTFFLYLSDVEEGGETNFPRLGLDVAPKKARFGPTSLGWPLTQSTIQGSALLWPSVLADQPTRQEPKTFHQVRTRDLPHPLSLCKNWPASPTGKTSEIGHKICGKQASACLHP